MFNLFIRALMGMLMISSIWRKCFLLSSRVVTSLSLCSFKFSLRQTSIFISIWPKRAAELVSKVLLWVHHCMKDKCAIQPRSNSLLVGNIHGKSPNLIWLVFWERIIVNPNHWTSNGVETESLFFWTEETTITRPRIQFWRNASLQYLYRSTIASECLKMTICQLIVAY